MLSRVLRHVAGKDLATGSQLDDWSRTVIPPSSSLDRSDLFFKYAAWQLVTQNMAMVMTCSTEEQRSVFLASAVRGFLDVEDTSVFSRALFACSSFYQIPYVFDNVISALFERTKALLESSVKRCDSEFVFSWDRDDAELVKTAFGNQASFAGRIILRFLSGCKRMANAFFPKAIICDLCAFFVPLTKLFISLGEQGKEVADELFKFLCRVSSIDSSSLRRLRNEEVAFMINESFRRQDYKLLAVWARGYFEDEADSSDHDGVASIQLVLAAKGCGVTKTELYGYLMMGINEECHNLEASRKNVKGSTKIVLPSPITSFVDEATDLLLSSWNKMKSREDDVSGTIVLASELLHFYTRVSRSLYNADSVRTIRSRGESEEDTAMDEKMCCADRFRTVETDIMNAAVSRLNSLNAKEPATRQERLAALQFISIEIGQQLDSKQKKHVKGEGTVLPTSGDDFQQLVELVMSVAANAHYAEQNGENAAVRRVMQRLLKVAKSEEQRDACIMTCAKGLASPVSGTNNAAALLLETLLKNNFFIHHDVLRSLFSIMATSVPVWQPATELSTALRSMTALALFTVEHVPALSSYALNMTCTVITSLAKSTAIEPSVFAELTRALHMLLPNEDICGAEISGTLQQLTKHACFERDQQKAVFFASCVSRLMEDLASHDKKGWAFLYAHHILQNYLTQIDHAGGRGRLDSVCQAFHPGVCSLLSICNDEQVQRVHYLATAASKAYFQEIREIYQRDYHYKGKA